jgi:hypothetical protein
MFLPIYLVVFAFACAVTRKLDGVCLEIVKEDLLLYPGGCMQLRSKRLSSH